MATQEKPVEEIYLHPMYTISVHSRFGVRVMWLGGATSHNFCDAAPDKVGWELVSNAPLKEAP